MKGAVPPEAIRVKIAPSILAADFARLGEQVREAEQGGADRIHVDVMDGHFVPNLSMGPAIVASLRKITRLPLESHLMITNPDYFLKPFAEAGSDSLIVHWEGNLNLHRTVHSIRILGKRAGVAINPATPADFLAEILPDIDQVLVMTVDPGFGHQQFLRSTLTRIREMRKWIDRINPNCDLEVDGGIDAATARLAFEAGANVFVAGTSVFGNSGGPAMGMRSLAEVLNPQLQFIS
jgi:ribulose-phosphate 3-epimerase